MYLYLVRHGDARPKEQDPERHLSEKGMLEVSEIVAFLNCAEVRVDEIWHSAKERARRTALIIAEAVPHKNIIERAGLAPNDPVAGLAAEIDQLHEDIMIVGHLPFLSVLASRLVTGSDELQFLYFRPAGVVCLEKCGNGWGVAWMMDPGLLSKCLKKKN
ncbi:phosphohistidine phosphatase SixA [Candidatus Margulisiibacteriota bacterium]